ncbi:uncharacterized protein METZ01_LOCUS469474, partial [marine metagenome]
VWSSLRTDFSTASASIGVGECAEPLQNPYCGVLREAVNAIKIRLAFIRKSICLGVFQLADDRKLDGIHFMLPTPFDANGDVDL